MELHNPSNIVAPMKAISFKKRRNRKAALGDDVSDISESRPFCRSACNNSGRDRSSLGIINYSELRAMFHNIAEAEKARLSRKDSKKGLFASMIKPLSFRRRQKSSESS